MPEGQPQTTAPECPCVCFCIPKIGATEVVTAHGTYAVGRDGDRSVGPVLYPTDLVTPNIDFDIPTGPEGLRTAEHLIHDVGLDDTPTNQPTLTETIWPHLRMPVEGEGLLVPVEEDGDIAIQGELSGEISLPETAAEAPSGTAGEETDAGGLQLDAVAPNWGAARGELTAWTGDLDVPMPGEGPDLGLGGSPGEPSPGRHAVVPGRSGFVAAELLDEDLDSLWDADELAALPFPVMPAPEPPDPLPSPDDDDEDGGGGGGKAPGFSPPNLRLPPPALVDAGSSPVAAPPARPQPVLGPGDQAPATHHAPLHPAVPGGGAPVLVPGGMLPPTIPTSAATAPRHRPGGGTAPAIPRAPTPSTAVRPGGTRLPFAAPPTTQAQARSPAPTPAPLRPPSVTLPDLPTGKSKETPTEALGRALSQNAKTVRLEEPGPVGGPVSPSTASAPEVPGQVPTHLLTANGLAPGPLGPNEAPRTFAGLDVLSPDGANTAVDQGSPLLESPPGAPRAAPNLQAPPDGAFQTVEPPRAVFSVESPSNTWSDDMVAEVTAPLVQSATVVPGATLPGVGGGGASAPALQSPSGGSPPPQVMGGGRSQPSQRGKPSGKTEAYGAAAARWGSASEESASLEDEAASYWDAAGGVVKAAREKQEAYVKEQERNRALWAAEGGQPSKDDRPRLQEAAEAAHAAAEAAKAAVKEAAEQAAPLEAKAAALAEEARQAREKAEDFMEEILEENPQTGKELAHKAADRARQKAKGLEAQKPSRYGRQQAVQKRSTGFYKENQLDKKRRRKLSAADYKKWRRAQDSVEAAKDAAVRRELEGRKSKNDDAKAGIKALEQKETLTSEEKAVLKSLKAEEKRTRLSSKDKGVLRELKDRGLDRHDREKSGLSEGRAAARAEQAELDKKQRRALPPADYAAWRVEQDRTEAAEDQAVKSTLSARQKAYKSTLGEIAILEGKAPLNELQAEQLEDLKDKARELELTPEEVQEVSEDIPKRDGERASREAERTGARGPVGPPDTQGPARPGDGPKAEPGVVVPVDSLQPDGPGQSADPCAGCSCDPPCKPGELCLCSPITGPTVPGDSVPPPGGPEEPSRGGGPKSPEAVLLDPDPNSEPSADVRTTPAPPPPEEEEEPPTVTGDSSRPAAPDDSATVPAGVPKRGPCRLPELPRRLGRNHRDIMIRITSGGSLELEDFPELPPDVGFGSIQGLGGLSHWLTACKLTVERNIERLDIQGREAEANSLEEVLHELWVLQQSISGILNEICQQELAELLLDIGLFALGGVIARLSGRLLGALAGLAGGAGARISALLLSRLPMHAVGRLGELMARRTAPIVIRTQKMMEHCVGFRQMLARASSRLHHTAFRFARVPAGQRTLDMATKLLRVTRQFGSLALDAEKMSTWTLRFSFPVGYNVANGNVTYVVRVVSNAAGRLRAFPVFE